MNGDRYITLWRKTGEQCLDWDFHISENTHEMQATHLNLAKRGIRTFSTYQLGPLVAECA